MGLTSQVLRPEVVSRGQVFGIDHVRGYQAMPSRNRVKGPWSRRARAMAYVRDLAFAGRLMAGRIAERWTIRDDLATLLQLGAVPVGQGVDDEPVDEAVAGQRWKSPGRRQSATAWRQA
jgi:hypothetical protein